MPSAFSLESTLTLLNKIHTYPALTVGLCLFTFILLIFDVSTDFALGHKFSLYPHAPIDFDLNRISFYPLFHTGLFHLLFNLIGLFTPLAKFESTHGTIYTGITLNLLAVVTALQFSIVGMILYPSTHVVGLSAIVFSLITYYSYKEHQLKPIHMFTFQGKEYPFKTLYIPFITLLASFFLLPGSSFWGHLAGISSGFLLAMDYLKVLYPPTKVILYTEEKLAFAIKGLEGIVVYYLESEASNSRGVTYAPIFSEDIERAEGTPIAPNTFRGEGNVLAA